MIAHAQLTYQEAHLYLVEPCRRFDFRSRQALIVVLVENAQSFLSIV